MQKIASILTLCLLLFSAPSYSEIPGPTAPKLIGCTESVSISFEDDNSSIAANEGTSSCLYVIKDYATGKTLDYQIEITHSEDDLHQVTLLSSLTIVSIENLTTEAVNIKTKEVTSSISTILKVKDTIEFDLGDIAMPAINTLTTIRIDNVHAEETAFTPLFYIDIEKAVFKSIQLFVLDK